MEFAQYAQARMSWLRGLAYVLCQDWDRADDLAQASLVRVYAYWKQASTARSLDGYVRAILVREYLRDKGSSWSRRVVLTREPADLATSGGAEHVDLDLRGALSRLPPGQRAVLVLRYYCDQSVDQVAHTLGCSPGTVKSQSAKGLRALRRWLGPHEPEPGQPQAPVKGA